MAEVSRRMLNLRQLESFLAVVAVNGFHEAARSLGRSQPTLTQHIQKLEEELGAVLIVRGGGGRRLTREGHAFLPYARSLVKTAARSREAIHGRRLAIGASGNIGTYLLPPLLARHVSTGAPLPEVTIAPNPSIADKLERGELDVALMEWWDNREGFIAKPWRREPLIVIAPPSHSWRHRNWIDKLELLGERIIGGEPGTGTGRILAEALGDIAHELRIGLSLNNTEAVKNAVRCGLGVSIVMAGTIEQDVQAGALVQVPIRGVAMTKELLTVVPAGIPATAPTASLLAMFQEPGCAPLAE